MYSHQYLGAVLHALHISSSFGVGDSASATNATAIQTQEFQSDKH